MDLLKLSIRDLANQVDSLSDEQWRVLEADPRKGVQALLARRKAKLDEQVREQQRLDNMLLHERRLWAQGMKAIAGVDEAGAGPLAGPVVAAAVVLPVEGCIRDIDDSKKLDASARERLFGEIRKSAVAWAISEASVEEIDQLNILEAARLAMRRAVLALTTPAEHLLVDARSVPEVAVNQTSIIKGDSLSQSIAAASILAKVHRDRLMARLDETYPGYGLAKHKGYGTLEHRQALERLGPSPIHRQSFAPVKVATVRAKAKA